MSRIGNRIITIPDGVTVEVNDNVVTVKGPKGELSQKIVNGLNVTSNEVKVEENVAPEEVKIEENNEILVENEENSETQISVEPTNVENKKNTTTKKVVNKPKKATKKAAKKKKNIFEIVKTFFTNIIKM